MLGWVTGLLGWVADSLGWVAGLLGWVAGLLGTGREFARVCSNRGAVGSQGVFERCSNGTLPSCRSTRRVLFFYSF